MTTPTDSLQPSSRRTQADPAAFVRGFENLPREHGFEPLRVEGKLPRDLEGTLYRNGLGLIEGFGERYRHWFDADGAVSAVRLRGGAALGAARVVKTRALLRERWAGRRLYGGSYNTPLSRPLQEFFLGARKSPANASVLVWQKRLFAACAAGLPVELSPDDLETIGETSFGDEVLAALSAHPHEVPARRAAYNFGLRFGRSTHVDILELPHAGRARRLGSFSVQGKRILHDFIATDRHLVFLFAPFFVRVVPLLLQSGVIDSGRFRPEVGTEIVVVPIDDPSSITTLSAPPFLHEHTVNAFERKGSIIFDFTHYPDMDALERFVGKLADGVVRGPLGCTVQRGVIDLASKTVRFEERLSRPLEMPKVSPRVEAGPYRFAYFCGHSSTEASHEAPPDVIVKADIEAGRTQTFHFGRGQFPSEAVFVPRRGGITEDDGYLLTLVYDARSHTSHLAVLDARDPGRAPLARAHFDHAIPFGFHGCWVAAS